MEAGKEVSDKKGLKMNEVVLQIPDNGETSCTEKESNFSKTELTELGSSLSLEEKKLSPEQRKAMKFSTGSVSRRRSLGRSEFSKPKSRFVEPPYPTDAGLFEERTQLVNSNLSIRNSPDMASPKNIDSTPNGDDTNPVNPQTPLIETSGVDEEEEDDDDDEVYKTANLEVSKKSGKKWKSMAVIEWIAFVCAMGFFIVCLTVHKLQNEAIWGLELWKLCVMALVILCARLITKCAINILVFLIERNFLFKKKILYFVYGVKKSFQAFIWLLLVLLAWGSLFNGGVKRSIETTKVVNYITRGLASCLVGAAIWLAKTLLIKLLASYFQSARFFDRIQESIFHHYILRTLSGPPLMEMAERVGKTTYRGELNFRILNRNKERRKEEIIDVDKLKKMKQEKISAWTMRGLVNVIRSSGLSTISYLPQNVDEEKSQQRDKEITSEWEAKAAAYQIFRNVAKPGNKYIDEEDLLHFMKKDEVENVLPLFEGAVEAGKITRKSLKNWLVKVYLERQSLAHSLNDTKTAVEELNRLASVIILLVIMIVWLLLMGFLTTKVLVFLSSQLLLVAFMFGNTAKTVFEAIIFVFLMHPFDVGDRCVIDGVQMVVEEMNILNTVFLRYDNEKIFYPNSVLATKPISNFYRSPEMSDSVEFSVDVSTSIESIGALKSRIKAYLESRPEHWRPAHSVIVKDIVDINKMKMALFVNHTINFQNYRDKNSRRSELILELKKLFEQLNIKYHLLPQEVHLKQV